jgi:pyrroloquinoline quinone (PQQ) biosynthesis protein C
LVQAPRDAEFGLEWVIREAMTRELQERAIAALVRKCHILWSMLDAIHFAYVEPGLLPPMFPSRGSAT